MPPRGEGMGVGARVGRFLIVLLVVTCGATLAVAQAYGHGSACRRGVVPCEAAEAEWGRPVSWLAVAGVAAGLALALAWWRGGSEVLLASTAAFAVLGGVLASVTGAYLGRVLRCERTPGGACAYFFEPWALPLAAAGVVLALAGAAVLVTAGRRLRA